jgi:hypothetical protein
VLSIRIKGAVGMCLAFKTGGLIIGLQEHPPIGRRPDNPSNQDTADLI